MADRMTRMAVVNTDRCKPKKCRQECKKICPVILCGNIKPNLGRFDRTPDWKEILTYFRGSELQNYFTRFVEDDLKSVLKIQHVDEYRETDDIVETLLRRADERGVFSELCDELELNQILDRNVKDLSGGELQRFSIGETAMKEADIYMFDEPPSYLDVRQRLKATQVIRSLLKSNNYVIVVEHDVSVLDYLSDFICCLYGTPGAYGVVTFPFSVREGINVFLAGFGPAENLRFRDESLIFRVTETPEEEVAS
ncbi:unnamed protein product [Arabis nemorensis]|uniref:ABC transporter domain-containing protein n=1 Tax=Arabis nemorensis TaxID=586526 RepID=A0A565BCY9_9BRAS|nr:unnamed protein product [Arabis nemorensis]